MNQQEKLNMKGRLTIRKRHGSTGAVEEFFADNAIVLSGRELVARMFVNDPIDPLSHVAVGSGESPVNPETDIQLEAESFRKALDLEKARSGWAVTDDKKSVKVSYEIDLDFEEGNGELREAGLFNSEDPENSVMYNRVVFPMVTKTSDFQLSLIWEIVF